MLKAYNPRHASARPQQQPTQYHAAISMSGTGLTGSSAVATHGRQHCWACQASARQVHVSGDRQTNEQTEGHRHRTKLRGLNSQLTL